jgi:hypothetical protein
MLYWVDTGWGCGGIETRDGVVIDTAPIFRKFMGGSVETLKRVYDLREAKEPQ